MSTDAREKQGHCPRCGKFFTYKSVSQHKPFPFCSARCREVDLGNWFSNKYVIPGEPVEEDEPKEGQEEQ